LLLIKEEFSILSDHLNLTYIYNPLAVDPTLTLHVVHKLQRWALKLSVFAYRMEHVAGEVNYWTDLLTRWGVGWVAGGTQKARTKIARLFSQPYIMPAEEEEPKPNFPAQQEIMLSQKRAIAEYEQRKKALGNSDKSTRLSEEPPEAVGARGLRVVDGVIWIPAKSVDLQLRLCVEAHCGAGGHRGYNATFSVIKAYVFWRMMAKDIKVFVQSCPHCVASASGEKVARPLGTQVHATKPNELLHFDFLHMGLSKHGFKYLLLLKYDLSGYIWLVPCKAAAAEETIEALPHWFTTFGVVLHWFSDQGSHFKNTVMQGLQKTLTAKHHFTTANFQWSNGTIQAACKQVIRVARAMLAEFKMDTDGGRSSHAEHAQQLSSVSIAEPDADVCLHIPPGNDPAGVSAEG
jgi:hypothetical protein